MKAQAAWTDPPDIVAIAAVVVNADQLLDSLEYDALILAQLALSANREARFDDRDALRDALEAIRDQVKIMLATFNALEGR